MRNKKIWKRVIGILSALIMCTGVVTSMPLAQGPSTDVWIDVVKGPSLARISVTVPMTYGFAVYGTTELTDTNPVTVDNGSLLISNVQVNVIDDGTNHADYNVEVFGMATMPIKNYSTDVLEANFGSADPPRVGLPVLLNAKMVTPTDVLGNILSSEDKAYWEAVSVAPTDADADFKKYRLSLDGKTFSKLDVDEADWIHLEGDILLPEPPNLSVNGYSASGLAYIPSVSYLPFGVEVGGKRRQYHQVEHSVKVGQIIWSAEAIDQQP